MTVNIALVQFWVELNKDFQFTSKKVERYLQIAAKKHCSIICFPEDFWFGPFDYYSFQEIENIVSAQIPKIITWFQQKAKE